MFDTKSKGQKSMLLGLSFTRDTSLKFSWGSRNHESTCVSLGSSSDHVFNKISMSWGINDGAVVFFSIKFIKSNVDSDTSFSFSFKFIQDPSISERSFSTLFSFFLKFFNSSLINTSTFDNQMSSGSGFSRVNVSNDNNINTCFFTRRHL